MKKYHTRFVRVVVGITLILQIFTMARVFAKENIIFKDIDQSSTYARSAIVELKENNILKGDQGYFYPQKTVNRAEMVTMLVRVLELELKEGLDIASFKDVPTDHWAFKYIEAAHREGIIKGISEDTFGINKEITREEIAVMVIRSLGIMKEKMDEEVHLSYINELKDADEISTWAKKETDIALAFGLMEVRKNDTFGPKEKVKREELAVIIYRLFMSNEEIQHPALYHAIVNNQKPYRGEIQTSLIYSITDFIRDIKVVMEKEEINKVNNGNFHLVSKSILKDRYSFDETKTEVIKVDDVLYMKDFQEEVWLELGNYPMDSFKIDEAILKNYANYWISNEGEVVLEGTRLTKYIIKLPLEDAKLLLPLEYISVFDFMAEENGLGMDLEEMEHEFEFYVSPQNEIVKIGYSYNFLLEEEGRDMLQIKMGMVVAYGEVGTIYDVKPPEESILIIIDYGEES
ncbi:S-layer homology domain-containing protein [Alkaliphilus transvaalensis]|uniref:S-layer homology domain-containing protein n=1 Tax=Alkaliphilus transvaalensis TaxID=114628 RepID=UPI00047A71FC|nr:S-layer homology domain-containing protein [Alkaliphilus transvaalensis]